MASHSRGAIVLIIYTRCVDLNVCVANVYHPSCGGNTVTLSTGRCCKNCIKWGALVKDNGTKFYKMNSREQNIGMIIPILLV